MELIIQKAVELGVSEIVPAAMKNCVVKLDEKRQQKSCRDGRLLQRAQQSSQSAL